MEVSTSFYGLSRFACDDFFSIHVAFAMPALPQNSYTGPSSYAGPSSQDNRNLCKCNTVTYNLISACAACQEGSWITCVDAF